MFVVLVIALVTVFPAFAQGASKRNADVVIYVTGQALYYDSRVTTNLPMHGRFQKLEVVNGQLQTEFGPGDQGYVGGRWWMDVNGNNVMDEGDNYFGCPLLGPGRTSP
jgi:hypothetical protein